MNATNELIIRLIASNSLGRDNILKVEAQSDTENESTWDTSSLNGTRRNLTKDLKEVNRWATIFPAAVAIGAYMRPNNRTVDAGASSELTTEPRSANPGSGKYG